MRTMTSLIWFVAVVGGFGLAAIVARSEGRTVHHVRELGLDRPEELDRRRSFPVGMAAFHAVLGASALSVWMLYAAGDPTTFGNGRWWGLIGLVVAAGLGVQLFLPWYRRRGEIEIESSEQRMAAAGVFFHGFVGVLTLLAVVVTIIVT
jgi:FtsH-binding integral membrane protein